MISLFNLAKLANNQTVKNRYKKLKVVYKKKIKAGKVMYHTNLVANSHNKSKKLWQIVNKLSNNNKSSISGSDILSKDFIDFFVDHVSEVYLKVNVV